jgi:ATP-dependent Lon protease
MEQDTQNLAILPVRNTVVFPYVLTPLSVERSISVSAVQSAAASEEKEIFIVSQKNNADSPAPDDLFTIGTKAVIKKLASPRPGIITIAVQGIERAVLIKVEQSEPHLVGRIRVFAVPQESSAEIEALRRAILEQVSKALSLVQSETMFDFNQLFASSANPMQLVYTIGSILNLPVEKEQAVLEAPTVLEALRLIHTYVTHEIQVLELSNQISKKAQTEMSKEQRDYLLRQQKKAIEQELGERDPQESEVALLKERFEKTELPDEVRKEAEREMNRLSKLQPMAPDYHVIRTYLELILELPWTKSSPDVLEINRARQVLDEDHYNLKEIKERILEHLGVLKLNPNAKAPILCFVGPPGVGKTSLGQSIARALGRSFERLSLGGMHDEAELRGHRRTYIGALPGSIIRTIRRAEFNNPVLMLDEIDKLGRDFRGDPAAALLEILDPEQNKTFRDNYLDLPFDLSKVFFITTANVLDTIPTPLLDRMEILRLSGYSEEEKTEIAKRYLIPKQLKETGLTTDQVRLTDQALSRLISRYTREAGVRELERMIGRVMRRTALLIAEGKNPSAEIQPDLLVEYLGPERFFLEEARRQLEPGVATGLAWTESGGDVLYIEATLLPEGRSLTLTGHLGDVMQESARAAHSYLWANAQKFGIDTALFHKSGVHIHVPAGAIRKDGPSAGITIVTALASLYTSMPADSKTAMTGEITLAGLVLPIGGLKEKILAARRAGLNRVILPKANEKDLRELPEHVQTEMKFVLVEHVTEVLTNAIPGLRERIAKNTAA